MHIIVQETIVFQTNRLQQVHLCVTLQMTTSMVYWLLTEEQQKDAKVKKRAGEILAGVKGTLAELTYQYQMPNPEYEEYFWCDEKELAEYAERLRPFQRYGVTTEQLIEQYQTECKRLEIFTTCAWRILFAKYLQQPTMTTFFLTAGELRRCVVESQLPAEWFEAAFR